MTPTQAYWNAIAMGADTDTLNDLNDARVNYELRLMRQSQVRVGAVVSIIEVLTPWQVVETADV